MARQIVQLRQAAIDTGVCVAPTDPGLTGSEQRWNTMLYGST
jgi:hypothetical protein